MSELFRVLRRRRDAFFVPLVIILAGGMWLSVRQKKIFEVSALFRVKFTPGMTDHESQTQGANRLVQLAQSKETISEVLTAAKISMTPEEIIPALRAGFDRGTSSVRLFLQGPERDKITLFMTELGEYLVSISGNWEKYYIKSLVSGINEKRDKQEAELGKITNEIREMQNLARVVSVQNEKERILTRIDDIEVRLDGLKVEANSHQKSLAKMRNMLSSGRKIFTGQGEVVIQALRKELIASEIEFLRLQTIYQSNHPKIREIKLKIVLYRKRLEKEVRKSGNLNIPQNGPSMDHLWEEIIRLETRLASVYAEKGFLEKKQEELETSFERVSDLEEKLAGKLRTAEVLKKSIGVLVERESLMQVQSGGEFGNLVLVEGASKPLFPKSPNLKGNFLFSLFFGCIFGLSFVMILEQIDRRIVSAEEAADFLKLPGRGLIPDLQRIKSLSVSSPEILDPIICTHLAPAERENEAFRLLRTNILHSFRQRPFQTMMIVSPTFGCGVSSVSANLAVSLAQLGNKVILVDCDFRGPSVHKMFRVDNSIGFINLMVGMEFSHVVHHTQVHGLRVIPSGPIPPNPSELMQPELLEEMVNVLKSKADFVIFDNPTLGTVSDSLGLVSLVQRVFFLVGIGKTEKTEAKRALDLLYGVDCSHIDLICNRIPAADFFET